MRPASRLRFAGAAVLLTFVGVWISHTLEMVRVLGTGAVGTALGRPVHVYMLPAGLVLGLLAVVAGLRAARAWRRLGLALDTAGLAVRAALRPGRRVPHRAPVTSDRPSTGARLLLLWWALAALQLTLYVLQENLEYRAMALPAPGLSVLTGAHWAAPLIHLYVAFVLATVALIVQRRLQRRRAAVVTVARLLRVLVERLERGGAVRLARPGDDRPIRRRRLPHALWCRPPPGRRVAVIHPA
ncbi:MAG TPA: hypothetical protein VI316_02015 [Candidatus Dormibacteraeota bacterium]